MFQKTVILSAARTAVGKFGGALRDVPAIDLAAAAMRAAMERAGVDPLAVDEVVVGCVGQHGRNAFLARIAALGVGCSEQSAAQTVNRLCASGLQGIVTAAMTIESGGAQMAIGGGAESMSGYPYYLNGARWGLRMGALPGALEDALTTALSEPFTGIDTHIATTAETIAERYGITREAQDAYALESQNRALRALREGLFADQIVPIEVRDQGGTCQFDVDEGPRATSMEKLAKLKPFAKKDGTITAGNAAGINDGAAALVMASEEMALEMNVKPIARLVDYQVTGVSPSVMGLGPVPATRKLLEKTGIEISDIGLVELNEAFAAQALACVQELGLDPAIVNVNGSGISLGHPIGATGAIIVVKLLHEMRRRGVRYGLATLCIGGGQGMSALFELL